MSRSPSMLFDGHTPVLDMTYWYFALLPKKKKRHTFLFFTLLAFWEKEKDSR